MTDVADPEAHLDTTGWIVVGVDGSASSVGALRRGVRIAEALKVDLVAIAAWSYPAFYSGSSAWSPENDAKDILTQVQGEVFPDGVPDWFHAEVHHGPAAQVLIAASTHAEMLIVGSRGHGGFSGLLLGSVSQSCVEYAKCPVLVLHEPDE